MTAECLLADRRIEVLVVVEYGCNVVDCLSCYVPARHVVGDCAVGCLIPVADFRVLDSDIAQKPAEYKRIILKDTANRLFKVGDQYNADNLIAEQSRIVNNIRDNGYYYVSNEIVSFEIDTLDSENHLDAKGNKTLSVKILINFSKIKDKEIRERHAYKFYFNNY